MYYALESAKARLSESVLSVNTLETLVRRLEAHCLDTPDVDTIDVSDPDAFLSSLHYANPEYPYTIGEMAVLITYFSWNRYFRLSEIASDLMTVSQWLSHIRRRPPSTAGMDPLALARTFTR